MARKSLIKKPYAKKITLREYGMSLHPLSIENYILKTVQKEDEVRSAREFYPIPIPEMTYPKSGLRTTSLKAFFSMILP